MNTNNTNQPTVPGDQNADKQSATCPYCGGEVWLREGMITFHGSCKGGGMRLETALKVCGAPVGAQENPIPADSILRQSWRVEQWEVGDRKEKQTVVVSDDFRICVVDDNEWHKGQSGEHSATAALIASAPMLACANHELRRDLAGMERQCAQLIAQRDALKDALIKIADRGWKEPKNLHESQVNRYSAWAVSIAAAALHVDAPVHQSVNVQMLEALRALEPEIQAWAEDNGHSELVNTPAMLAARAAVAAAEAQLKENDEAMLAEQKGGAL